MSDTAFNKCEREAPDEWWYIGRFISGFAWVEYQIDQLLYKLNVNGPALWFLVDTFDLRKKLELIKCILESLGIDESKMFKRIHALHDLRNVIAHWPFQLDLHNGGLSCDYGGKHGSTFPKPGGAKDNFITFAEFDAYHAEATALFDKLQKLIDTQITDFGDDLQFRILEAIQSSNNVVRFARKLLKDGEDETEDETG